MTAALNRFYAGEPACLWTRAIALERPSAAATSAVPTPEMSTKEARALENGGLLEKERHGYKLTHAGSAFWRPEPSEPGLGNLCFGTWHVTRIDRRTARHDDTFGDVTDTEFDASVGAPALWTRMPAIQREFPQMAAEVSRPLPHSAILKHTDKGWQVAAAVVPTVHP